MAVYTLGGVGLDTGSVAMIKGVQSSGLNLGLQQVIEAADGGVDPSFFAVQQASPLLPFMTTDLATLFALNSSKILFKGMALSGSAFTKHWFTQMQFADEPWGNASSKHILLTTYKGILLVRGFSATQGGGAAQANVESVPTWGGTNDAVTVAVDQAGETFAPVTHEYTIGPVTLNSTDLDAELQGTTYDSGISLTVLHGGGIIWPRFAGIRRRTASFGFAVSDAARLSTFGTTGTALTSGVVYLRRLKYADVPYADGETQHIKITLYDVGVIRVPSLTASGDAHVQPDIVVDLGRPTASPNEVIKVEVGVAIT